MPYTRPTTDLAKEGLFNIIENNLNIGMLDTLDLFGGTGCISYELASRGAKNVTVVEKDPIMARFIKETSKDLGFTFEVIREDVFKFLQRCDFQYDLVFAGPPYALTTINDLPDLVFQKGLLKPKGWFILEHTPVNNYKDHVRFKSTRNYGTTVFSFFV